MLSSDRMSINYREFPDRIRKLFGSAVEEDKDLDHWHYDMMGQTLLIRNAAGDYAPAHRSLLEFFVAYKFAAELGILSTDFVGLISAEVNPNSRFDSQEGKWSNYFSNAKQTINTTVNDTQIKFVREDFSHLRSSFGGCF